MILGEETLPVVGESGSGAAGAAEAAFVAVTAASASPPSLGTELSLSESLASRPGLGRREECHVENVGGSGDGRAKLGRIRQWRKRQLPHVVAVMQTALDGLGDLS